MTNQEQRLMNVLCIQTKKIDPNQLFAALNLGRSDDFRSKLFI